MALKADTRTRVVRNASEGIRLGLCLSSQTLPQGAGLRPGTRAARSQHGRSPAPKTQKAALALVFEARRGPPSSQGKQERSGSSLCPSVMVGSGLMCPGTWGAESPQEALSEWIGCPHFVQRPEPGTWGAESPQEALSKSIGCPNFVQRPEPETWGAESPQEALSESIGCPHLVQRPEPEQGHGKDFGGSGTVSSHLTVEHFVSEGVSPSKHPGTCRLCDGKHRHTDRTFRNLLSTASF